MAGIIPILALCQLKLFQPLEKVCEPVQRQAALSWGVSLLLSVTLLLLSLVLSLLPMENLVFVTAPKKESKSVPRGHGQPHVENRYFKQEATQFVWQILKLPFSSWEG